MKIIFLSLTYEREKEEYYKKKVKCNMLNASTTFQYAILDGLEENGKLDDLYLINSYNFGTYKKYYDELFLKGSPFVYNEKVIGKTIPCVNVHVLKQIGREIATYKEIKKYIKQNPNEKITIITYNVYEPYLRALAKIKKKFPNVTVCPIITDMPGEFGILPTKFLLRRYVLLQGKKLLSLLKKADKFVFLTEQMKEPLGVSDNYMIMEGIYSNLDENNNKHERVDCENKVILYTGSLNPKYGIYDVLQAFKKIDKTDVELWICGGYDDVSKIEQEAKENNRIKFFGYVTREQALKFQRSADLLVNPRPNNEEFVKYSFPSKTMEYMASGKPVLMHRLAGIPEEYDKYLNYFTGEDSELMAKDFENVLYDNNEECVKKAQLGKQFILNEKNSKAQTLRLIEFLEGK